MTRFDFNGSAWVRAMALLLVLWPAGCGPRPVAGGTQGILRWGEEPLADIQLTVHRVQGGVPTTTGFGVTGFDGKFALFTNGAQGPLKLEPGEYRFTLESVGSPLVIPPAWTKPESTPLQVQWPQGTSLELQLPK